MRLLPLWLHVLGAAAWLGGLLFQSHVLFPVLTWEGGADALATAVHRFRRLGWAALTLLVLSGFHNLTRLPPAAEMAEGGVIRLLALKLFLAVVVLMLAAQRDFGTAARLIRAVRAGENPSRLARTLVRLDRALLLLGAAIVYLGLAVSRGGLG